ncbi:adenosylcobinamide amidohydrolase [Celeribacter sp.]|uniref:adenosylcobinamide amidohydrolase n=1 Tax=Celeribacter sp. TaxID=1890673 RepID=UPI003A924A84
MLTPTLTRPWLVADLGAPMRVLSFAPYRPGFVTAKHIVWRELRNADLPPTVCVSDWISSEMAKAGHAEAVGMLTSRNVTKFQRAEAEVEGIRVAAIATVGLGNAERIGSRTPRDWGVEQFGTINIAVQLSEAVTETAQIEALTIAAQARTVAVMEAGLRFPHGPVTGTGTDCLALAAPPGDQAYAGLHTALGEAIGAAVYRAVSQGAAGWVSENPVMMRTVFGG